MTASAVLLTVTLFSSDCGLLFAKRIAAIINVITNDAAFAVKMGDRLYAGRRGVSVSAVSSPDAPALP